MATQTTGGGGGNFAPRQTRGGKFCCGKFRGAPWVEYITPRQSPHCALLVCEQFAENPEFRVGNFAVNLKRDISHAKLKRHEPPPPRMCCKHRRKSSLDEECGGRMRGVEHGEKRRGMEHVMEAEEA